MASLFKIMVNMITGVVSLVAGPRLGTSADTDADADVDAIVHLGLLDKLARSPCDLPAAAVTAQEVGAAISQLLAGRMGPPQAEALLRGLHQHGLEVQPQVLQECAAAMRAHATPVDIEALRAAIAERHRSSGRGGGQAAGRYRGGLCDIVGTGGDGHDTFNVSTTASIIASALILVAKHGNRASTSKSGSADVLDHMRFPLAPAISAVTPATLPDVYAASRCGFLFAHAFHPRMRFVSPIRRAISHPTIFNLLGPLVNPVEGLIEARVVGVRRRSLGPAIAEALRIAGAQKTLVVCGDEDLDEISCAGPTQCWMLGERAGGGDVEMVHFVVEPADFGLGTHALTEVGSGGGPAENAETLRRILAGELADDEPVLEFVLLNAAALFVMSGICEDDASGGSSSSMGPGDDGAVVRERGPGGQRWKEGVRRARWAIRSGEAWSQWQAFVDVTNRLDGGGGGGGGGGVRGGHAD